MANDDRNGRGGGQDESLRRQQIGGRPQRLGERNYRGEADDPDYGAERYGGAPARGFGGEGDVRSSDPDSVFGAVGYDAGFGGPRFDRLDVGSTGTHGVHPVASPYGADYRGAVGVAPGGGWGSSARRYAQIERAQQQQQQGSGGKRAHDPYYAQWRQRQMEQLDRDYEDYCREHQSRFDKEFGEWRERRGRQRQALGRVAEHMEVVGSDGSHVGTVDAARDDRIILTKNDPASGGHHHMVPCSWVDSVDDKVRLNLTAAEAMKRWRDVEHSGALFDRGAQSDG
jgi:hypothetical protein